MSLLHALAEKLAEVMGSVCMEVLTECLQKLTEVLAKVSGSVA
jgi:hypothetical protein